MLTLGFAVVPVVVVLDFALFVGFPLVLAVDIVTKMESAQTSVSSLLVSEEAVIQRIQVML